MTETPTREDVDQALRSVASAGRKDRGVYRYCPTCSKTVPSERWDGWKCTVCGQVKQRRN